MKIITFPNEDQIIVEFGNKRRFMLKDTGKLLEWIELGWKQVSKSEGS